MVENSAIEWCNHTFNPWLGCTKISAACDHCYAEGWAKRTGKAALWTGDRQRTSASNWRQPIKWDCQAKENGVRYRVFCASLADVFDNQVPEEWRSDLWRLIAATPNLDWLLLTKRPQNISKMLPQSWGDGWPNVWLGTTAETQSEADRRVPLLFLVPAQIRFLSCEPLLGQIKLRCVNYEWPHYDDPARWIDALAGTREFSSGPSINLHAKIDWVICGGESGPGARPMHPDWARLLRDECAATSTPFLFKQWGDFISLYDRDNDDPDWRSIPEQEKPGDRFLNLQGGHGFHGDRVHFIRRVGKKSAGRSLDGCTHDKYPNLRIDAEQENHV